MLMQQDISKKRGLVGRLLVGGATLAVLATTATLVPAGIVMAKAQTTDIAEPPAPPAPPEPPLPPEAPDAPGLMVFTEHRDDGAADGDAKKREVRRIVIRRDGEGDGKESTVVLAPGDGRAKRFDLGLSRDDVMATLKEQGVTGDRAEAIADKLEAKRKERIRTVMAPLQPLPPMPPMPHGAWGTSGQTIIMGRCSDGKKAAPIVNRDETDGNKRSRVYMLACNDTAEGKAARLSALKKARESFAEGERARGLSEAMRKRVAADLEKAIADMEKSGN